MSPDKAMDRKKAKQGAPLVAGNLAPAPKPSPPWSHPPPLPLPPGPLPAPVRSEILTQVSDASKTAEELRTRSQHAQKDIDAFWSTFNTKFPGKAFALLPKELYFKRTFWHTAAAANPGPRLENTKSDADQPASVPPNSPTVAYSRSTSLSYEAAVAACKAKVSRIKRECEQMNEKYRDINFDIESDFQRDDCDLLTSLGSDECTFEPGSVKRVPQIFDNPEFYVEGATPSDVRQGKDGNCWLLAAIAGLCDNKAAIDRICVAQEPLVGVYGFVFHRDGEWFPEVIDDQLYLIKPNYNNATPADRENWNQLRRENPDDEWRIQNQKGSKALYFASCAHPEETWVPLLEKAYAKAHNDYNAIEGGFCGEAFEDLTGGVASEVIIANILDHDKFWKDELIEINKKFIFGCAAGFYSAYDIDQGIRSRHAYSILEAREIKGKRFLRLRNPWGSKEWSGPWSDGSAEWTAEWIKELGHQFGDDGVFWITYEDLLKKFEVIDRTRLFGPEWQVAQLWTALQVPWAPEYLDTKFDFTLTRKTSVVIVLSQLDIRYFKGLEGPYNFHLQFRIQKKGQLEYLVRSQSNIFMKRSTSAELTDLEAGTYSVRIKVIASETVNGPPFPEDVVKRYAKSNRKKFLRLAFQYDYAHAKAGLREAFIKSRSKMKQYLRDREKEGKKNAKEYRKKEKLISRRREMKEKRRMDHTQVERETIDHSTRMQPEASQAGSLPDQGRPRVSINARESESLSLAVRTNQAAVSEVQITKNASDDSANTVEPATTNTVIYTPASSQGDGTPANVEAIGANKSLVSAAVQGMVGRLNALNSSNDRATITVQTMSQPHSDAGAQGRSITQRITLSDISSSEASWDSEIDGHFRISSDDSDSDSDIDAYHERLVRPNQMNGRQGGFPDREAIRIRRQCRGRIDDSNQVRGRRRDLGEAKLSEDEDEDSSLKLWNAVCVVGLRVFSENTEDGEVKIELIRPERQSRREKHREQAPDVDGLPNETQVNTFFRDFDAAENEYGYDY